MHQCEMFAEAGSCKHLRPERDAEIFREKWCAAGDRLRQLTSDSEAVGAATRARRARECPFCRAASGDVDTHVIADDGQTFVLRPLNPVTKGHLLIIPRRHLDSAVDADGREMESILRHVQIIMWGTRDGYNLICNQGEAASQTVDHLHWHLVPRREGDGLMLPWTNQVDDR